MYGSAGGCGSAGRREGKVKGGLLKGAGLRYVALRGVEDIFSGGMDGGAGLRYVALRCVEDVFAGGMDEGAGLVGAESVGNAGVSGGRLRMERGIFLHNWGPFLWKVGFIV